MLISIVLSCIAITEAGCCIWFARRLLRMEQLDERRREKLTFLRQNLLKTQEKLYTAETERDWYKGERNKAWTELAKAREEKKQAELRCCASMDLQKAAKPTLAGSVKEVETKA